MIILAEPHGYCGNANFGVRGAIKIAQKTAQQYPGKTYLLGEIVHNQHVVDWLEKKYRIKTVHNLNQIPKKATVIIRAHGAPPWIYAQAKKRGLNIIDATCPLVAQVHQEVKKLATQGKKILYLASKKNHDEAVGMAGEAGDPHCRQAVTLVTLTELEKIKISDPENTVILTQTTLSILETKKAFDKLKAKYPQLTIKPHVCPATTQRQQAIINLAQKTDLVIIVGSHTSSNSNRLKEVAEQTKTKSYLVDNARELKPAWFKGIKKVAISSGASTPEWLLTEVIAKIKNFQL